MIIDCHTHVFPDKIAERAIDSLSMVSGGLEPHYNGTIGGLLKRMDEDGVDKSIVLNIATNAHQMQHVNDFASSINHDRIISFGSVYPDAPDVMDELERIKELGLKGVKFHPEYQSFFVDDEKMRPIYKKIGELGLVTVFHAGSDLGFKPPFHCTPDRAVKILPWFDAPVVFAHWGGWLYAEEVEKTLAGTEAYFDLSFGYGSIPRHYALKIVEKHGTEKLLLGSDGPWHTIPMELRLMDTLGLTNEEKEKIYHQNAEKLLKLH